MDKRIFFNNKLLDKYQTKAVKCKKNSYLVVAGAGSGKTLTICAKVKYLLENNYKENEIICISFTNETVNSLKNALLNNGINISVKTFHKLALEIIKDNKTITNNILEYIVEEYFESIIYNDKTYLLLQFIDNLEIVKKIIVNFINQMKSMNYNNTFLLDLINDKLVEKDDKILLVLIFKIYIIYEEELKSEDKIDFNDIINLAIEKIDTLKEFNYKYIIIDEYQDTSESKYLLIKKLFDKFNIKLMAVGDDYQSIYSFTGCNLNLFINFKKYFPKSKIIKMKYTYRNPNDIVEISKRFVMRNNNQINKRLKTNNYIKDAITVVYQNNEEEAFKTIMEDLDNVLIIGRNNKDIDNLIESKTIIKDNDKYHYLDKNINYLTVHKSKGLEEDYIIILNAIDDTLGFPNQIKENKIFNYLKKYNELEEERRLFYVAITRARKRVFIFTQKDKESLFVKEIIKCFKYKIKIIDLDQKNFK